LFQGRRVLLPSSLQFGSPTFQFLLGLGQAGFGLEELLFGLGHAGSGAFDEGSAWFHVGFSCEDDTASPGARQVASP
jgi:hypothetical protein